MQVLGFLELPEEDTPPEEYWHSQDHLKEWFDSVKQRREDRFSGMNDSGADEEMTGNEAAAKYK